MHDRARRLQACQVRAAGPGPRWRSHGYRASRHRRRPPLHRSVLFRGRCGLLDELHLAIGGPRVYMQERAAEKAAPDEAVHVVAEWNASLAAGQGDVVAQHQGRHARRDALARRLLRGMPYQPCHRRPHPRSSSHGLDQNLPFASLARIRVRSWRKLRKASCCPISMFPARQRTLGGLHCNSLTHYFCV